MSIIFYAVQFIEASLLSSAFLFTVIMFVKTRDAQTGRTLFVLAPVASLLFISYMYSINMLTPEADNGNMIWLSPLYALAVITLIVVAIFAAFYYVTKLFPISQRRKKITLFSSVFIAGALLVVMGILVMYISKSDMSQAVTNALRVFYSLSSIALFVEAIILAIMYKRISDVRDKKLARYFLIAFIPQILYSIVDYLLLKNIEFQLTNISYTIFSILVFVDLSSHYFKNYSRQLNISDQSVALKNKYTLSEREIEVTGLLAQGLDNKTISEQLHISVNTVKSHIKRIYNKLGVSNRLQLMNVLDKINPHGQ